MIKRFPIFIFAAIALSLPAPKDADAHVTLVDKTMEVFSHIDPDDDPIARDPGGFFLVFDDTSGRFDPRICDCAISVSKDGEVIWSEDLFASLDPDNATTTYAEYSFPERGLYDVEIRGVPEIAGAFEPFEVHRIVRVERESAAPPREFGGYLAYFVFGLAFIVIAILFVIEGRKKRGPASQGSARTGLLVAFSALLFLSLLFHEIGAMEHVSAHGSADHHCCSLRATVVSVAHPIVRSDRIVAARMSEVKSVPYVRSEASTINNNSPPL